MPNALMPDTSSYDDPAGNALLARGYDGTAAGRGAIDIAQGAMNLGATAQIMKLRDAQIGQEQLNLGRQRLGALNGVLGALVTNPTPQNFTSQLGWAVQNNVIDPDSALKASQEVSALGGDPARIKQWATDHLNQNAQHEQLMDQAYGKPGMISNGAVSSPTMVRSGAGGGYYPGAGPSVQQQLSPEAATAPQSGPMNPDGSPTQEMRGQAVQRQGGVPAAPDPFGRGGATVTPFGAIAYPGRGSAAPMASLAGGSAAPPAAPHGPEGPGIPAGPVTDGLYKRALETVAAVQNMDPRQMSRRDQDAATMATNIVARYQREQATPAAGPAPTAPASPPGQSPAAPGPITVGLPAGAGTAADRTAAANVDQGQALQRAADAVPANKATIANLETDLNAISTGPLASRINVAKSTYNQVAGIVGAPQIDPGGVAKMEQFHKNAAILAGQQFAALGGTGTDQQLGAAISANPSEALSTMGNRAILAMLKGNQDAIAAKNTAYQNRPAGQSYAQFAEDWNRHFSPRAFQLLYMSPADRAETYASMSKQEKEAVGTAYNTAVERKWIDPSRATR